MFAHLCIYISVCLHAYMYTYVYEGETACLKRWEVDVGWFPQLFSTICVCKREIGVFTKFGALQNPGSSCFCLSFSFGKISLCPMPDLKWVLGIQIQVPM